MHILSPRGQLVIVVKMASLGQVSLELSVAQVAQYSILPVEGMVY